jgi:cellulose synthase/poly-beta-1,6-N-acetylglucosamine synthase-like glycosyltransferase
MGRSIAPSRFERTELRATRRPFHMRVEERPTDIAVLRSTDFAARAMTSIKNGNLEKAKLALIIPAYNEENVLEHTVNSAVAAGLPKEHIYIVDDYSSDATTAIARRIVGDYNLLRVGRSGKGGAIYKVANSLQLTKRYEWVHIADADGSFDTDYFAELFACLDTKHAAATGYVASLPGGPISQYRAFEYTIGMDLIRRFQAIAGVITIVPGPTSIFRSDVFEKLEFSSKTLCEDFDITLQLHRKKLGSIQFIPSAVTRTQDPSNLHDFIKQITRWNRGVMQMFIKHRIGFTPGKVDAYLSYQIMQNVTFFLMYALWVPVATILTGNFLYMATVFLSDVILMFSLMMFVVMRTGRKDLISAFPVIYLLRFISLGVFIKCFVEVMIMRKFLVTDGTWERVARRAHPVAG